MVQPLGGESYIEDLNLGIGINGTTDTKALLLTTRKRDSLQIVKIESYQCRFAYLFSNFRQVAIRKHVEVRLQARVADGLPILFLIPCLTKSNVFPNSSVLQQSQI